MTEFNKWPSPYQSTVHELLETASERFSNNTAIVCGDKSIAYRKLNSLANHIARFLLQRNVGCNDLVGVVLDRSIELVAVLLAVLKTGAAYVPIEPALPFHRMMQMTSDAGPKLLITSSTFSGDLASQTGVSCLEIEEVLQQAIEENINNENIHSKVSGHDLAYVMYTSGSTGRPKGVEITHASICNLLLSMQQQPGCTEADRLLAITTISFDMAVPELFLPLICGATTIIAQRDEVKDMPSLARLMKDHKITIMQGTPAIWQMLLNSGWCGQPRLAKIFCGGEALPRALADHLLLCCDEMWNLYGPTEATVYASLWRVLPDGDVVIGGALSNCHLYILDENMSPVLGGQTGELCIGGAGVARGYHNNTELSQTKFVDDPFHMGLMYRTGDVARFVSPEIVSVSGRADGQVKIRGYRIETGEIETAITAFEGVSTAVVLCREERLVAYVVRKAGFPATDSTKPQAVVPLEAVLRSWLSARLPAYMVPAFFVAMEAFPVTMNGKIDRRALPDPVTAAQANSASVVPVTELEAQLLDTWSKILGFDHIGVDQNFFEIGGDSARLVLVQKEIEAMLDRRVPGAKLFEHYTIRSLAQYLTSTTHKKSFGATELRPYNFEQDIAIISMACRLPGGITTPEGLWKLLERGGDVITEVPVGRWDLKAQGRAFCSQGGFLSDIYSYDTSLFGISPREASMLDPAQYMMLETCWESFERAGYTTDQLRDSATGVFIGTSNILAHQSLNPTASKDLDKLDGYTVTGSAAGTMSGRVSYQFGLQGPTMTIDTACSSSLVTTHLACNALRLGECDMAVSGGISLMLNPGLHIEFGRLQGMSPDGRCRSFSEDTQGTGWSEGSVVVILKRLEDAKRDGDTIHAVIRGTAVNHDGRSATLTTPSGLAQERLIHKALSAARLTPEDLDYIEAHGTGTKLGDPIEATALAEVFGPGRAHREPLLVGSVKSNLGHAQAAAGLTGLLKVVLSMQNGVLPQTLHITKPTPAVDWQAANMTLVLENLSWPEKASRLRRAGVSAFGIGGTNAHVIVEEAPKSLPVTPSIQGENEVPCFLLFLLSGNTEAALRDQAKRLHHHVNTCQDSLVDVAYSLATSRNHLRHSLVVRAKTKAELLQELHSFSQSDEPLREAVTVNSSKRPKIAVLFSGQGSQWPGMGKSLCDTYPVFKNALMEIVNEFNGQLERPLLEVMWAEPDSVAASLLDRTYYAQPALFALEMALWRLWESWGVAPDFVLGHSLGELVAAHVAGIFDLQDACRMVVARGRLMQTQSGDYSMIALNATPEETALAIQEAGHADEVDIALYNTPNQTVISGKAKLVENVAARLIEEGHRARIIVSGHAFHSRQMDGILAEFHAVASTVQYRPPSLNFVSSLDDELAQPLQLSGAEYWVKQIREPVRFSQGIHTLLAHGVEMCLEMGPDQILCDLGVRCLSVEQEDKSVAFLPSLTRRKDGVQSLQDALTQLHMRGVPVNWKSYFEALGGRRVQLSSYAFQRNFRLGFGFESQNESTNGYVNGTGDGASTPSSVNHDDYKFEVVWHPATIDKARTRGTWGLMITAHDGAWATTITAGLSEAGFNFVQVENLEHATTLDGVICLWDTNDNVVSDASKVMAVALSQLQTAAQVQFYPPLVWVTRHAVGVGMQAADEKMRPGAAALLWGLMRTARNEHPELNLRLIDVDHEATGGSISSALVLDKEPEYAVRQDRVLVPRLQRARLPAGATPLAPRILRTDGAVLITGGLGHFGAYAARWLAVEHGIRDIILVSRQGLKATRANATLDDLSKLGTKITVLAGDVASRSFVSSIMSLFGKHRPLRGVIHAAGVVDSGVVTAMTPERCNTTIAPKAFGAWLLHQATMHMDLDLLVMVSSISGVIGMPGLANYAAANAFLDALAYSRRAQGLPATSVAYGTLGGDGGMASRLGQNTRSHLAQFGLDPLSLKEGVALLEELITSDRTLTVAAALDLERLQRFMEEDGGVPPLLSVLLPKRGDTSQSLSAKRRDLRQILSETAKEKRFDVVLGMVQQVTAKALGYAHPQDVDVSRPLKDVGIDSLTAVQVRNHLAVLTGMKLSVNITLNHTNLRALSEALLSQMLTANTPSVATEPTHEVNMAAMLSGCLESTFKFDKPSFTNGLAMNGHYLKSVFLTGATGFVGSFVLYELLKRGITTYCLVRSNTSDTARQKLLKTLQDCGLWEPCFEPLIKPVVGDIAQPLLGLAEEAFDELSHQVGIICHSGALVDWMRPLQDYVGPNILGAHEILRLSSKGCRKAIHLVSTISTLPKHMGLELKEGDLEYGYGTSKYIAEKMVAAARWRGATAYIYRLPYVTASASGHFRRDRGDFLHNLITGCLDIGTYPSLNASLSAVLPVDYLAQTIVSNMLLTSQERGLDLDFLNGNAPSVTDFFQMMNTTTGGNLKMMPFGAWKQRAMNYAESYPQSPIARISAILDSYTDQNAETMFKGLMVGENVLGSDGCYPAPPIDEQFVRKYVERVKTKS